MLLFCLGLNSVQFQQHLFPFLQISCHIHNDVTIAEYAREVEHLLECGCHTRQDRQTDVTTVRQTRKQQKHLSRRTAILRNF